MELKEDVAIERLPVERQRLGDPESVSTIESIGSWLTEPRRVTHQDSISSVRFLADGKHIVTGSKDGTVRQWKIDKHGDHTSEGGKMVHSEQGINAMVVSKDGKWIILAGTESRRVTVWDALTHERIVESMDAHEQKITALDVSADGSKIASGSQDGAVIVWSLETGHRLAGPFKSRQSVLTIRFSPTGDHLAVAGWDFMIHVWNVCSDGNYSVPMSTDPTYSLAWSNDGRRLFAGCCRGAILCLDVSSPESAASKWPVQSHIDSVSTLSLSSNGKFIISASSSECSVKIWDVRMRSEIGSLKLTGGVLHAEISPDDGRLVCGAEDGKLSIWNLRKVLPMSYFYHSLSACMTSTSCSESQPILTHVSNAAYISWRKAELSTTEEILSSEIERSSSPLQYNLANRSLIRARLRQWDGAWDDARASHRAKPSLVALLAMSIAQSGRETYHAATETLNVALEYCDREERVFVNVIKAITLFGAGRHDEAIRHLHDLVFRTPDAKRPCAFVQAKMYTLLATAAMQSLDYAAAIPLLAQARDLCPSGQHPEINSVSLIVGWAFDGLRLSIYQQLCEACYAVGRTQEVLNSLGEMESIFRDEIMLRSELNEWLSGFKFRCIELLECQGGEAMYRRDYDSAIAQYSAALNIHPAVPRAATLFVKRSETRAASCLWGDALNDADEAIRLDPSSPRGYERRHAALHGLGRYEDAIHTLTELVSMLENSPDPQIRDLRGKYINPSDATDAIREAFKSLNQNSPFRFIDTASGRLCGANERWEIFKGGPAFEELVSSMTTQLLWERIKTVTGQYFQYLMLSHRWEEKELILPDVLGKCIYELDASPASTKLQGFCILARNAKVRWAWSDTCCINKENNVEFEKSINSMFDWYRNSAATIVYLTGVPPQLIPGALKGSIWMKRGWTLQELLAPPIIRFYHQDWTPYLNITSINHKQSAVIMQELEDATAVAARDLLAFRQGQENIRVKLRLASTRETTVPVDMAYGLFGIFGLTMHVIHGEKPRHALGRLLQQIVALAGDVACLAWVGQPSDFNSAFPDHIKVYEHASHTVPHVEEENLERWVVELRRAWTQEEEAQAVTLYQRLRMLPPARCTNQHLYLPCIVFPLPGLREVERTDGVCEYALKDTDVYMESKDRFLSNDQDPDVLVCPWIHELLDTNPPHLDRHRHPRGATLPDVEDAVLSHHPSSSSAEADAALKAARLVVRFRQSFGALFLQSQGHGQYRRVAADRNIVMRVHKDVPLDDVILQTLEII